MTRDRELSSTLKRAFIRGDGGDLGKRRSLAPVSRLVALDGILKNVPRYRGSPRVTAFTPAAADSRHRALLKS